MGKYGVSIFRTSPTSSTNTIDLVGNWIVSTTSSRHAFEWAERNLEMYNNGHFLVLVLNYKTDKISLRKYLNDTNFETRAMLYGKLRDDRNWGHKDIMTALNTLSPLSIRRVK